MAKLDKVTQKRVDDIVAEGSNVYGNGDLLQSVDLLKKAWQELPNSKYVYDDSYHIARFISKISMELNDFTQSKEWAFIVEKCDPERGDIGEKEFLIGQVAYESGEELEALRYLKIANDKSDGLCFQGEDEKYRKLLGY